MVPNCPDTSAPNFIEVILQFRCVNYFPPTVLVRVSVTVRVSLVDLLLGLPIKSQTKLTLTITLTTDTVTVGNNLRT